MRSDKLVLVDSNILIALYNKADAKHAVAVELVESLQSQKKVLNHILLNEVATVLLLRTKNNAHASQITHNLLHKKITDVIVKNVSNKLMIETSKVFQSQNNTKLSFADCSIIAQARLEGIGTIVTFDKDLVKAFGYEFEFI